jgi:hypothetical protein
MPITTLTYRTADATRWGGGQGSDLAAVTIDLNFWAIFTAIKALEAASHTTVSIDFISQTAGNQLFIHLTNSAVLGPFIIPSSQWDPRGRWQPSTPYAPFDTVSDPSGNLYLVTLAHTSALTFNPFATDGSGHDLYALIIEAPLSNLPINGIVGQYLVFTGGSPTFSEWRNAYRNLALYIPGQPQAGVTLFQYCCTEDMFFPVGLEGSVVFAATQTLTTVSYPLFKNGNAIGAIIFNGPSPDSVSVQFVEQVNFVAGDVITMNGPSAPDAQQAGISFTLQATLAL